MQDVRQALVGKTITGVISRPGKNGLPELIMLALEDGSYMQFVVPSRQHRRARPGRSSEQFTSREVSGYVDTQLPLINSHCG